MLFEKNMCIDFANIRPIFLKMVLKGDERKIKFISKKHSDTNLVPSPRTLGTTPSSIVNMTEQTLFFQGKILLFV